MLISAPSDDQILAFLRRHGLPADVPVERSSHEGVVNHVRLVGDLCVRVLKETDYASDIWTETVAAPAVRAAGANVPELVAFDASGEIVPTLVTVYRRVAGEPLGQVREVADLLGIYKEVGHEIGVWHRGVRTLDDPEGRLDKPELPNLRQVIAKNAERMSDGELRFVDALADRLESAKPSIGFVHWDLHAHNLMVHEDRLTSVIDWGDAGWGDSAINFHCLPAEYLPEILEVFGGADQDLAGRCLYGVLAYAINDIHRTSDSTQRYRNSGHRRWESFLRLRRREGLGAEWRHWLDKREISLT